MIRLTPKRLAEILDEEFSDWGTIDPWLFKQSWSDDPNDIDETTEDMEETLTRLCNRLNNE